MEAAIVADYRELAGWRQARLAVCAILSYTQLLAEKNEYRRMARDIDRLSVSVLENLAKGFEGDGDETFLRQARHSITRLNCELTRAREQKALSGREMLRLRRELNAVERYLDTN